MIKTRGADGMARVTFTLDRAVGADTAVLYGDFNGWAGDAHRMQRSGDGSFSVTVELEPGRAYRFRYLLDGTRWENDWAADDYVPNDFGGDDSVVDLIALAEDVPPATAPARTATTKPAPAKKAAAKGTAKKAGGPVKKVGPAAAAKKAAKKKPA